MQAIFVFLIWVFGSYIGDQIILYFSKQSEVWVQDSELVPEVIVNMMYAVAIVIGSHNSVGSDFFKTEGSLYKFDLLSKRL